jgi:hypothetical protein
MGNNARTLWFDNFMCIDLTASYGAGFELKKIDQIRQIITNLNGFFGGTIEY